MKSPQTPRLSILVILMILLGVMAAVLFFEEQVSRYLFDSQILLALIIVSALVLLLLQTRITNRRLEDLKEVASQIGRGNYDARSEEKSPDAIGEVAAAVNRMAEKIGSSINEIQETQKKLEIQSSKLEHQNKVLTQSVEQQERFGDFLRMIASIEVNIIARQSLQSLMRVGQAQIGLFYTYEEQRDELILLNYRSVDQRFLEHFNLGNPLEGLPGEVIRRKEWITLEDIDPEALPDINLGFTRARIRNLFAIPITFQSKVLGVVILAGLARIDPSLRRLLGNHIEALANALTNALNYRASQKQAVQLEEANRELLTAHKQKSEFVANMSHELRTPLNSIIGFSGILLKNRKGNLTEADLERVEKINRNGRHLLNLINDILDLSKIEAGRMDTIIEKTDLVSLVQDVVEMLQPQAEAKDLVLRPEIGSPEITINTDGHKLKQVLINLAANAIKFTKQGSVTLTCHLLDPSSRKVRIQVVDTGIGIPRDKLDVIFEAFTQADASTTREFGGTGLGLAISKSIVELLGGRLTVASEVGVGSTFTIEMQEVGSQTPFAHIAKATQAPFKMTRPPMPVDEPTGPLLAPLQPPSDGASPEVFPASPQPPSSAPAPAGPTPKIVPLRRVPISDSSSPLIRLASSPAPSPSSSSRPPQETSTPSPAATPAASPAPPATPPLTAPTLSPSVPGTTRPPVDPSRESSTKTELRRILPIEPGKRVLIIDDDPDAREFLGRYIEELGAGFRECDSGFKALDIIREYKPDLITLDISMPGINGWDTLALIKQDPEASQVPVIIVSILADKRKALALGAVDALAKPVAQRDFLEACRRQLNAIDIRNRKILVIDDTPEFRQLMKSWLDQEANEIRTASNGREALEVLESFRPDIIFLDLMMPVMDGTGFLREFRAKEKYSNIPVVVVTAKSLSQTERSWIQNRAERIMQKGDDLVG